MSGADQPTTLLRLCWVCWVLQVTASGVRVLNGSADWQVHSQWVPAGRFFTTHSHTHIILEAVWLDRCHVCLSMIDTPAHWTSLCLCASKTPS